MGVREKTRLGDTFGQDRGVKSALCLWTEEVPRKPVLEKPLGGVWGGKGVDTGVRIWSTCGMQH